MGCCAFFFRMASPPWPWAVRVGRASGGTSAQRALAADQIPGRQTERGRGVVDHVVVPRSGQALAPSPQEPDRDDVLGKAIHFS
jgi:hypothetical protein